MEKSDDMMKNFEFLIGDWQLDYTFPRSEFSAEAGTGEGSEAIRRILGNKYVCFDYSCSLTTGNAAAHAIFARDDERNVYRFWWFEDSGSFMEASCQFINDNVLFINWHNSLLIQTFEKDGPDGMTLTMKHPDPSGEYRTVLPIQFTRKQV